MRWLRWIGLLYTLTTPVLGGALSVDCAVVITLEEGGYWPSFQREAERVGLDVGPQWEPRWQGKGGGSAGCWKAHDRAVREGLARGCERLAIFEDDAFFVEDNRAGLDAANAVLEGTDPWEIVYLGYVPFGRIAWTAPPHGDPTIVRVGFAMETHAYILHRRMMERWVASTPQWSGVRIDEVWSSMRPTAYAVFPMIAFQHHHRTTTARQLEPNFQPWHDPARVVAQMRLYEQDALHGCRCATQRRIDEMSMPLEQWDAVCDDACALGYTLTTTWDGVDCIEAWCDTDGMIGRMVASQRLLLLDLLLGGWKTVVAKADDATALGYLEVRRTSTDGSKPKLGVRQVRPMRNHREH